MTRKRVIFEGLAFLVCFGLLLAIGLSAPQGFWPHFLLAVPVLLVWAWATQYFRGRLK